MVIETLEVGPFAENCYVVGCEETSEGVIIDPGAEIRLPSQGPGRDCGAGRFPRTLLSDEMTTFYV